MPWINDCERMESRLLHLEAVDLDALDCNMGKAMLLGRTLCPTTWVAIDAPSEEQIRT
jgi:hypothetical protein